MGFWNHRVVKKTYPSGETLLTIREVFYNDDGTIYAYTEEGVDPAGETIEEIKETLERMERCLDKPILVDGEVKFVDYNPPVDWSIEEEKGEE